MTILRAVIICAGIKMMKVTRLWSRDSDDGADENDAKRKRRNKLYVCVCFTNVLYRALLVRDNIIPSLQVQFSIKKLYIYIFWNVHIAYAYRSCYVTDIWSTWIYLDMLMLTQGYPMLAEQRKMIKTPRFKAKGRGKIQRRWLLSL